MLKIGNYNVCFLDLLTDSKNGRFSSSKIWKHFGFVLMSYVLVRSVPSGTVVINWEFVALFCAYGAIVAGSEVATMALKWGLRDSGKAQESEKS